MRQASLVVPEEYHHLFDTGSGSDDNKEFKADAKPAKPLKIKRTITRVSTFKASDASNKSRKENSDQGAISSSKKLRELPRQTDNFTELAE